MSYLLSQIFFCLLLACLCGVILGYMICKFYCKCSKDRVVSPTATAVTKEEAKVVPSAILPDAPKAAYNPKHDVPAYLSGEGYDIETLEGIGKQTGDMFRKYGIATIADYLCKLYTPESREVAAKDLNIRVQPLHDWACMSDLMRVTSVDHQSSELLYASGVRTVSELAVANAAKLHQDMETTNNAGKQKIAPNVPDVDVLNSWINNAKDVNPLVRIV
jgi:Domain of unknown function (DUF4332)